MKPFLLIASPQMKDPFFEGTLVLVWHHDEDGAIGVVINKTLHHSLSDVLALDQDDIDLSSYDSTPVGWGGPVERSSGTVVTTGDIDEEEGWPLSCGLGVTRSQEALVRLLNEGRPVMLCLGYAGWGPGQLDSEIERGGWLWTDLDPKLVFAEDVDARYDLALATLGLTRETVWMQPISE